MAAETTRTSLTEIVRSEMIRDAIIQYGIDNTVILPTMAEQGIAGQGTATVSFPQWELDAVSDLTTEGTTTLSNVELQTTEVATISAAPVGILREVTKLAARTNILGEAQLINFLKTDGAKLCFNEAENDPAALFSGFSTSVGTTGVDFAVATWVQAIAKLRTLKARGTYVGIMDDEAANNLMVSIASSAGTVFANSNTSQSMLNANSDGYLGNLFGVDGWVTNLTDQVNTDEDVCSAMYVDGSKNPDYAALGYVVLWDPEVDMLFLPDQVAHQVAITFAYGVGRVSEFGVKMISDAP